jgi:hypothetical protein
LPESSSLEALFDHWLGVLSPDLPTPVSEYVFAAPRKYRADRAWPERKLLVELEGGVFSNSRHTTGTGFTEDCHKYNLAIEKGFRVLRFTSGMLRDNPQGVIASVKAAYEDGGEIVLPPAVNAEPAKKWRVGDTGLHILAPMDYDEWLDCWRTLWQMRQSLAWAIGDAFAYGEDHFGDDAAQALSLAEYSQQTIDNYTSVSRAFPQERRVWALSHSHYDAARGFRRPDGSVDVAAQESALSDAVRYEYSREDVRQAARDYKAAALTVVNVPPVSKLAPTYDDLLAFVERVAATDRLALERTGKNIVFGALTDIVIEARYILRPSTAERIAA